MLFPGTSRMKRMVLRAVILVRYRTSTKIRPKMRENKLIATPF